MPKPGKKSSRMAHSLKKVLRRSGTELVKGWVVPTMAGYAVTTAVGTIGAVIMPHNLFLHSTVVLSRRADGDPGAYTMRQASDVDSLEARTRAWQSLCRVILATNEFIFLE